MTESLDHLAKQIDPELRCGDCRSALPPERASTSGLPAGAQRGEYYCPICVHAVDQALSCPGCGSLVCAVCGTPVESADDIGIG